MYVLKGVQIVIIWIFCSRIALYFIQVRSTI